ncbi:MAG: multiheme c-type cytochrome [Alphaproteobacteria bacterium]
MVVGRRLILAAGAALASALWVANPVGAQPFMQGPEKCKECHEAEFKVWEGTRHFTSFREVHKSDKAKDITAAVGGDKNMKKNEVCTQCHYSLVQKDAGAAAKADAGPSCESCHGASSDWFPIHNDYGGKDVKRADETAEHRAARYADAHAAGLLWPDMRYDVALNCMSCHGLDRANVDGETLAKMLAAGHPLKPEFELVQYSQGSVRHRFYPSDFTVNQELDAAGLAELFVQGAAAKLVTASAALAKSSDAGYQAAQQKRIDMARAAIEALGAMAEAQALLADPSDANARALVAAIAGQDLTAQVGSLLPGSASYK